MLNKPIGRDPIAMEGHILRFQTDTDLGETLFLLPSTGRKFNITFVRMHESPGMEERKLYGFWIYF